MHEFDDAVLQCFLDNQGQLFPEEDVASNLEEAEAFLEECLAVVVNSLDEVWEFFYAFPNDLLPEVHQILNRSFWSSKYIH